MKHPPRIAGNVAAIWAAAYALPPGGPTSSRDIPGVTGIVLWLIYGLMLNDMPLIASNAVTFLLSGTILALKLRHG
jgi:hypothetical protein